MEWGNLVFIGLVIVQAIPGDVVDVRAALFGVLALAGAYFVASQIMKGVGG